MKENLKDKIDNTIDYSRQWLLSIVRVIFTPIFIVLEIIKIIVHPIAYLWIFFQCEFLFKYYIRRQYFNVEYDTLLLYNINLNYPSRLKDTLQNRIYRWCAFKIFKRNNYKYDPNKKVSW